MTDQNDNRFPDQLDDYRIQQVQLARRRELARSMIDKGLQSKGEMVSGFYVPKNPWQNFAEAASGSYMQHTADKESTDLAAKRAQAQNDWQTTYQNASTPAEKQAALTDARNRGLRYDLEKQFSEQEAKANETEAARQLKAQEIAAEKEANRAFLEQQKALDRENRKELRAMPTTHVTVSGGGSSGKDPADVDLDRQLKQARIDALKNPKPVASERKAALAQDDLITRVDNALAELDRNPEAVGMRTLVPNIALNRMDPTGTAARAAIGELSAEKAHEIYGASFTAAERTRADKFIPADGDDLHTIRTKLAGMKKMAEQARARAMGKPTPAAPVQPSDKLSPAEQQELDRLRAKHGRK